MVVIFGVAGAQAVDIGLTRSMPVGSVGGGVIALLLALSLMMYCYRAHSRTTRRYLAPDTSVNMFIVDKGHPKLLDDTLTGNTCYHNLLGLLSIEVVLL